MKKTTLFCASYQKHSTCKKRQQENTNITEKSLNTIRFHTTNMNTLVLASVSRKIQKLGEQDLLSKEQRNV